MRRLFLLTCALLATAPSAVGAQDQERRVDWHSRLDLAMEEALVTRRPVLITFYTDWCTWCRKLEAKTFKDPNFVNLMDHLVGVRVNGDKERGLAAMYRVRGYPFTVILNRKGQEIGRIRGYKPPGEFANAVMAGMGRRESFDQVGAAAESRPDDPEAQYDLGDVLMALGRFEDARPVLARIGELDAVNATGLVDDAALDMALSHLFAYDFEGSLPLFETYLAEHPTSDRVDQGLFFYGVALIRAGRSEEGLAAIEQATAATTLDYIKFEAERLRKSIRTDAGGDS